MQLPRLLLLLLAAMSSPPASVTAAVGPPEPAAAFEPEPLAFDLAAVVAAVAALPPPADLSPELPLDDDEEDGNGAGGAAAKPRPVLLLAGRKFPLDLAGGALQIHGTPLFVLERPNSGLGTGLTTWDGAVVLAKLLERRFARGMRGLRVVEVGAGTGVAGVAAGMLGADALLTDLPYALDNLRECARRNAGAVKGSVAAAALDWAAPRASAAALPEELRGRLDPGAADVVLGADVVWVPELIAPLVSTLRFLAGGSGSGGEGGKGGAGGAGGEGGEGGRPSPVVLIAHQTRSRQGDALFFESLRAAGFTHRLLPRGEMHPDFSDPQIDVVEARLAAEGASLGVAGPAGVAAATGPGTGERVAEL